jgi:hypothetical protein
MTVRRIITTENTENTEDVIVQPPAAWCGSIVQRKVAKPRRRNGRFYKSLRRPSVGAMRLPGRCTAIILIIWTFYSPCCCGINDYLPIVIQSAYITLSHTLIEPPEAYTKTFFAPSRLSVFALRAIVYAYCAFARPPEAEQENYRCSMYLGGFYLPRAFRASAPSPRGCS